CKAPASATRSTCAGRELAPLLRTAALTPQQPGRRSAICAPPPSRRSSRCPADDEAAAVELGDEVVVDRPPLKRAPPRRRSSSIGPRGQDLAERSPRRDDDARAPIRVDEAALDRRGR